MLARTTLPLPNLEAVRKTILAALLGLMGGGAAVHAQTVTPAAPAAATTETKPDGGPASSPPESTAPVAPTVPAGSEPDLLTQAGFVPSTGTVPVMVAKDGQVVEEPMDEKTAKAVKKLRDKFKGKQKQPKQTPLDIVQGTLTVDGWTGKARMNYDIADLKYIYVWAPGVGTVVISSGWFSQGEIQLHAFNNNTLTVAANGHTIQVTSEKRMLGKKQTSAFVWVDPNYNVASTFPVMGYGNIEHAPYAWPGAKTVTLAKNGAMLPPPLPKDLRPVLAPPGCPPPGSRQALNSTPCTDAVIAARSKAAAALAASAATKATSSAAASTASTSP